MKKIALFFMSLIALTSVAGNPIKGVDRNNLDPSTKPGENFYQYACGGWIKNNPLKPEYSASSRKWATSMPRVWTVCV